MSSSLQGRANVRWMDYARRSMQRLGFVKWVLQLASKSQAQTLESLTRTFFANVTAQVPLDETGRQIFGNYLREMQLHRRYHGEQSTVQKQDKLLSDPRLPSHTGPITGDFERKGYRYTVYVEIPTWATRLQLLRTKSYTLTDRGRVLLMSGSEEPNLPSSQEQNLLYLGIPERYVCLYSIIDADGDFLVLLYKRLLESPSFTRSDVGEVAEAALRELRDTRLKHSSTGYSLEIRNKLDRVIDSVKKKHPGGLSPRESIATPRTEPLVDCGILAKPYPEKYEYQFTSWGKSFLQHLISNEIVTDFLEKHLSSTISSLTGQVVRQTIPFDSIEKPYLKLRSGIGYVSLRELALLTIAEMLSYANRDICEINDFEQTVKRAASEGNRYIRFALGRMGGISQVRIDPRIFTKAK